MQEITSYLDMTVLGLVQGLTVTHTVNQSLPTKAVNLDCLTKTSFYTTK